MPEGKVNNPQGINQYTKNGSQNTGLIRQKAKAGWEAIDKTVKYGAAGAAIGAATALGGRALLPGALVIGGTGAGLGVGASNAIKNFDKNKSYKENFKNTVGNISVGGLTGLATGAGLAALTVTSKIAAPVPIAIGGAVVGGVIGLRNGYKKDREEAKAKKLQTTSEVFKDTRAVPVKK